MKNKFLKNVAHGLLVLTATILFKDHILKVKSPANPRENFECQILFQQHSAIYSIHQGNPEAKKQCDKANEAWTNAQLIEAKVDLGTLEIKSLTKPEHSAK